MKSNTANGHDPAELGELELSVMQLIWQHAANSGEISAEQVREELGRPLKDSTVRTVLRRLEEKGYLDAHRGRADVPVSSCRSGAAGGWPRSEAHHRLVLQWVGRGPLLVGMVDSEVLDQKELTRLAERIAAAKKRKEMMTAWIVESALRSLMMAAVVWAGIKLLRVRNVAVQKMAWGLVLMAAVAMPVLVRWYLPQSRAAVVVPVQKFVPRTVSVPDLSQPLSTTANTTTITVLPSPTETPTPVKRWTVNPWKRLIRARLSCGLAPCCCCALYLDC